MPKTWTKWTKEEDEIIKTKYRGNHSTISNGTKECMEMLPNRTKRAISGRAKRLGVSFKNQGQVAGFLRRIKVTPGCWIWIGRYTNNGYGSYKWNGKFNVASRIAYMHYIGEIPNGMLVCHRCDNPKCVNPDHLFLGTNEENMIDMVKKGRNRGPSCFVKGFGSKLNDEQALEIINSKMRNIDLAKKFCVDKSLISHIRRKNAGSMYTKN